VQSYYRTLGRELWILDLTSDLTIPAFAAVSARSDGDQILFGLGAHRDAGTGIVRAITEMNQMLAMADAFVQQGAPAECDPKHPERHWFHTATLADSSYLVADPTRDRIPADAYAHEWGTSGHENVDRRGRSSKRTGWSSSCSIRLAPTLGCRW
jgi:ribosomal protein S12 methylthiotransferase accessory factor YcaO